MPDEPRSGLVADVCTPEVGVTVAWKRWVLGSGCVPVDKAQCWKLCLERPPVRRNPPSSCRACVARSVSQSARVAAPCAPRLFLLPKRDAAKTLNRRSTGAGLF